MLTHKYKTVIFLRSLENYIIAKQESKKGVIGWMNQER